MTESHLDFQRDHNLWLSVESHSRIFIGFSRPHLRTSSSGSHTRGSLETTTADSLCCTLGALPKAGHPTFVMINHNAERLWTPQPGNKPTWLACFVRRMGRLCQNFSFVEHPKTYHLLTVVLACTKYDYWLRWECKVDGWEEPTLLEGSATLSCAQVLSGDVKHAMYIHEVMDRETK